jgi:hypothetical protein
MASSTLLKPETTIIGASLEIPRIVSGLWQLAGGHDKNVDFDVAAAAMDSLFVTISSIPFFIC